MDNSLQPQLFDDWLDAGATFDPTRVFRYRLWRTWQLDRPTIAFIMLNPSTADEQILDPTLSRCYHFARRWGYGGMIIGNVFAYRSPYPADLAKVNDPIGPDNDATLHDIAQSSACCILGWGVYPGVSGRIAAVMAQIGQSTLGVFELTRGGHPKHPLYIAGGRAPTVVDYIDQQFKLSIAPFHPLQLR